MLHSSLLNGRNAVVSGLLLIGLTTVSCSSETEGATSPIITTSLAPSPTPSTGDGSLVPATTLDTDDNLPALSQLDKIRVVKAQLGAKTYAYALDVAADGTALMSVSPKDVVSNGVPTLRQRRLELWTPGGAKKVVSDGVSTRVGAISQTMAASLCGGVPIWAETSSVEVTAPDWRVWARPKGSQKPVLLGDSKQVVGQAGLVPSAAGPFTLTTDGATAFWPAVRKVKGQTRNGGWQSVILSRTLTGGGGLKVAAKDAMMPVALPAGLLYVTDSSLSSKVVDRHYQIRMVQGGVDSLALDQVIPEGAKVIGFTATDQLMVVNVQYPPTPAEQENDVHTSVLTVWRQGDAKPVTVRLHGDGATELHASGDLVAWSNGSGNGKPGAYVLDLGDTTINMVDEVEGDISLCGSQLSWSVAGDSTIFDSGFGIWQ